MIKIKHCIYFLGFVIFNMAFSMKVHAIVSIQAVHLDATADGWHTGADLGFSGSFGNTENFRAKGGVVILHRKDNITHYVNVKSVYGRSFGVENQNKSFMHLRRIQQISDIWALEWFGQVENNKFSRLNLRALSGFGGRTKLLATKKNILFSGVGMFYSLEDIMENQIGADAGKFQDLKGNLYLIYQHKFLPDVEFVSTTYIQPKLNQVSDYRVLENASLKFKLTDGVKLKITLDVIIDNKPPTSVKKVDVNYMSGIEMRF